MNNRRKSYSCNLVNVALLYTSQAWGELEPLGRLTDNKKAFLAYKNYYLVAFRSNDCTKISKTVLADARLSSFWNRSFKYTYQTTAPVIHTRRPNSVFYTSCRAGCGHHVFKAAPLAGTRLISACQNLGRAPRLLGLRRPLARTIHNIATSLVLSTCDSLHERKQLSCATYVLIRSATSYFSPSPSTPPTCRSSPIFVEIWKMYGSFRSAILWVHWTKHGFSDREFTAVSGLFRKDPLQVLKNQVMATPTNAFITTLHCSKIYHHSFKESIGQKPCTQTAIALKESENMDVRWRHSGQHREESCVGGI